MDVNTFDKFIVNSRGALCDENIIFCIKKKDFAMMIRENHSVKSLKKAVAKYRTEGFKVYYNEKS